MKFLNFQVTPMGQVPMLEIDGKKLYQSTPISRFLGKQYGLAGRDDWENLEIDMIAATIEDFRVSMVKYMYEPNEEVKNRLKEVALKESLPFFTQKLNEIVGKNKGYLALGRVNKTLIIQGQVVHNFLFFQLTWVDFTFAGIISYLNRAAEEDITAKNPKLKAVVDHVFNQKGVKEYIAKRPETPF